MLAQVMFDTTGLIVEPASSVVEEPLGALVGAVPCGVKVTCHGAGLYKHHDIMDKAVSQQADPAYHANFIKTAFTCKHKRKLL
jgi:hypothetical protein